MEDIKDINWFKKTILPKLNNFEIKYKFFENGDFGSLNQVEFNSTEIGGNIDFWELGWLGIFLWDFKTEKELINVLIEPNDLKKIEKEIKVLLNMIN